MKTHKFKSNINYFDEVKSGKKNLENKLKKSASKGYSGHQLRISDLQDDYLKRRLRDSRTIKCIEEKLGDGFHVKYHEAQKKIFLIFLFIKIGSV